MFESGCRSIWDRSTGPSTCQWPVEVILRPVQDPLRPSAGPSETIPGPCVWEQSRALSTLRPSPGPCETGLWSSGLGPYETGPGPSEASLTPLKPVLVRPSITCLRPSRTSPGPFKIGSDLMLLKDSSWAFWDHVQSPLRPVPGLSETRPGPSVSESSVEHSETRSKALWDHESRALWYWSKVLRFRALWGLFKTSLVWTVSKTGMRPFRTNPGPLKIGSQTLGSS